MSLEVDCPPKKFCLQNHGEFNVLNAHPPKSAHLALIASAQMNKIHHLSTNRINRCLVVWDLMDTLAEVKLPFIGGNLDSNHCKPTNIKKVAKMITDFIWPTKMMIDRANLGQLISVHQGCTDSSASTNAPDGGHAHSSVLLYEGG